MRFNQQQVEALAQLSRDRDFGMVTDALRAELDACRDRLLTAVDPVSIHRDQGRAEVLKTILDSAASARERMQQLQAKAR